VANFVPATQGISNFVTAPDYIPTVLIYHPTEEQIQACMAACQASGKVYNVYCETEDVDQEWLFRIERIADHIIDAQNEDPVEFFNK
jgi:hypothetical protein